MTNKEFDLWLRESLSSVQPELNPQDWDHFVQRVEESESQLDSGFDEAIRNAVSGMDISHTPDWTRMEQMLEADEVRFDDQVKNTIENFEVPYNPSTWPTLHAKLTAEERIRRDLVYGKVLEIVAVFILLLTFYNFFPAFKSAIIKPAEDMLRKELAGTEPANQLESAIANVQTTLPSTTEQVKTNSPVFEVEVQAVTQADASSPTSTLASANDDDAWHSVIVFPTDVNTPSVGNAPPQLAYVRPLIPETEAIIAEHKQNNTIDGFSALPGLPYASINTSHSDISAPASSSLMTLTSSLTKLSRVRFGMMAASDVNTLFFPEEHFYSQGRSINFSEKEIVAGGYSAGASLLFDFKHLMIETGLTYSSKNFGPDRNLFIGSSADRHTLDFENITLNIVSLPLYLHWKLDGKGLWRIYATGGASMHVIANANYDLIAANIYTSSAVQDPQQLQNAREVQRVREHMLDGAKFSSKGYLTAVGGLGIERYLNSRMSIFVQPMYHYQISFFNLIDQNGKHLQNGSLLLGTRISL